MLSCFFFLGPSFHGAHCILEGFLFSSLSFEFTDIDKNNSSFVVGDILMTATTPMSLLSMGKDPSRVFSTFLIQ